MKRNKNKTLAVALIVSLAALAPWTASAAREKGAFGTAFQDLAKEDQVEFVKAVNKSMAEYIHDDDAKQDRQVYEKRLRTVYIVNRDAVRAAPEKERKAVIAEVFATAPMEALPGIADGFAQDLFNRKAAGLGADDDSFMEFLAATLMRVRNRLHSMPVDQYPGARSAFAVISFIKASEGKPEDLRDTSLFYVLTGSQNITRTVWIPAALGEDDKPPSYQPILDAGYKGEEPPHQNLHPMSPVELGNLKQGSELRVENAKDISSPKPVYDVHVIEDGTMGGGLGRVPREAVSNPDSPWFRRRRGVTPPDEPPTPYMGQGL